MSAQTLSPAAPYVLDAEGRATYLPNLTARVRQVMPGDFLLNAADEPVVLVTKVEVIHGAHPRVRISGVTTPRASRTRRGFVKTLPASAVARITRPVLV
jgi:hypothetical protein